MSLTPSGICTDLIRLPAKASSDTAFVAVYDYTPAEPNAQVKSRLYLTSSPEGVCTFNRTSGSSYNIDSYVSVNVTNVNQQYKFDGWYLNDVLLTIHGHSTISLDIKMPH